MEGDHSLTSSSVNLRTACTEDAAYIAELGSWVFTATYGHVVPPQQLQVFLEKSFSIAAMIEEITNPMKNVIVATTVENVVLGFVMLSRGTTKACLAHLERTIELGRLYVDPSHHGKGIGKALVHEVEEIARQEGYKHIWLGVWEHASAREVYQKLGYSIVGDFAFDIAGASYRSYAVVKEL